MPSRNVLKVDIPQSFYHIYARGASRQSIFREPSDHFVFIELFRRYLSDEEIKDSAGIPYVKLDDDIELLCYCLMSNHFYLLVYQIHEHAMQRLMRGVMTAYSRYFNKKYQRSGSLFESRYKASLVSNDTYLMHISRYIHLNPRQWQTYPYSSLKNYMAECDDDWLREGRILELFTNHQAYTEFISDYESVKESLELIKHDLAGGGDED